MSNAIEQQVYTAEELLTCFNGLPILIDATLLVTQIPGIKKQQITGTLAWNSKGEPDFIVGPYGQIMDVSDLQFICQETDNDEIWPIQAIRCPQEE
jgi:hypothetical protein